MMNFGYRRGSGDLAVVVGSTGGVLKNNGSLALIWDAICSAVNILGCGRWAKGDWGVLVAGSPFSPSLRLQKGCVEIFSSQSVSSLIVQNSRESDIFHLPCLRESNLWAAASGFVFKLLKGKIWVKLLLPTLMLFFATVFCWQSEYVWLCWPKANKHCIRKPSLVRAGLTGPKPAASSFLDGSLCLNTGRIHTQGCKSKYTAYSFKITRTPLWLCTFSRQFPDSVNPNKDCSWQGILQANLSTRKTQASISL